MKSIRACGLVLIWLISAATFTEADQQGTSSAAESVVPRLIRLNGTFTDVAVPTNAVVSFTFGLYQEAEGGSPLWLETQNVVRDEQGRYTVLLGSTTNEGFPIGLFDQAIWLGVQPNHPSAQEQPRVLLVSVPYALKAADAETLGGRPASAYMLADAPPVMSKANGDSDPSESRIQVDDTPPFVASVPCSAEFDDACRFDRSVRIDGDLFFNFAAPQILFNTGGPTISVPAANTLDFGTSGLRRLRIDNHGNVGVELGNLTFNSPNRGIVFGDGSTQKTANKHARVAFSMDGGSGQQLAQVTLIWPTPFADTSYTVTCSVLDTAAGNSGLRFVRMRSIQPDRIIAVTGLDISQLRTGELHCIAIAD